MFCCTKNRSAKMLGSLSVGMVMGLAVSSFFACATERSQVQKAPAKNTVVDKYKAPQPAPDGAPTVMVSDLEGRAEGLDAAPYTAFVRRGLAQSRRAFVVLQSEQRSLLAACQSEACLQRVQHENASARYICTGNIARLGDSWVVSLSLVDAQKGTTLGRSMKRGRGDLEGLVVAAAQELGQALPEL